MHPNLNFIQERQEVLMLGRGQYQAKLLTTCILDLAQICYGFGKSSGTVECLGLGYQALVSLPSTFWVCHEILACAC